MAALKSEIDLRTREFFQAKRFRRSRLFPVLLVGAGSGAALLGLFLLHLCLDNLSREILDLRLEVRQLSLQVEPLEQMAEEIELLNAMAGLEEELSAMMKPCSRYLRLIKKAAPEGLAVETVKLDAHGEIYIHGRGESMHAVAAYGQAVAMFDFTDDTVIDSMDYHQDGYRFTILAMLVNGEGQSGHARD